jgi:regulator of sigma E protease
MGTTCRTLGLLFRPLTSRIRSVFTGEPADLPAAQIGVKHMSGPPGILLMLWMKLQTEGYRGGFAFIILITFSLAFMNLLPLPVLDGGHICFAALEGITRRRIPAKFFKYIYNFFAYLLIALMLYIMVFDGKRVLRLTGGDDNEVTVQQQEPAENDETGSGK